LDKEIKYNPHVHSRQSIRLKGYDYSRAGLYFITICTHNRQWLFGEIVNRQMILNDAGKIARECWIKIPEHFPNAVLHEYVVMPDHVHGIIELMIGDEGQNDITGIQNDTDGMQNDTVRVQNFEPLQKSSQNKFQKIIPRSVGSIIRGYKIGVTKFFRDNTDIHLVWQRNFYEHIIRNEQSYFEISYYIVNNPAKWAGGGNNAVDDIVVLGG
jgi:putative transposase